MRGCLCLLLVLAGPAGVSGAGAPTPSYRIETVAGSGDLGDGGLALTAELGAIQGVAADRFGNFYLSDTDHHRVRTVNARGVITTLAGTGTPGFSGDGGPASKAQLNLPYGVAVSPDGSVYVADLGNHRVRRIGPGAMITTVAGNGQIGSAGDGLAAIDAQLSSPRNLALDLSGNLYISEFEGHRIRRVSPNGTIITVAGTGVPGLAGDGGLAQAAQLAYPAGLAVDGAGSLYIADSQNHRVRKLLPGGLLITLVGGTPGTALMTPTAVTVDTAGTVYVADLSFTVRAYTRAGAWYSVAGSGVAGFATDGAPAVAVPLTAPYDLTVDAAGNLLIADGMRLREVTAAGIIQTVAGDAYVHTVGDLGSAAAARLFRPFAVALDPAGALYIADPGTQRVRKVSAAGNIETLAGTGLPGYSADGEPAAMAALNAPAGVAVDASGNVAVADSGNHRIRLVTPTGSIRTVVGTGTAGTGPEGKPPLETPLHGPQGLCADPTGPLYVVDTLNHRVRRAVSGAPVQIAAGTGVPGGAGDNGPARGAGLNQPSACALDTSGNLFIADTLNHRIRKVTPAGLISTVAGTGVEGFGGDEGPATIARLNAPAGVAVDPNGVLYLSDTGNHRIRQVTPDGVIHTVAGGDQAGFAGDGGFATWALLNAPAGLQLDFSGRLYFADTNNSRVRMLSPASLLDVSVLNAASLMTGPVAPGEILTVFVADLANAGGADARFDGVLAPVFYAQANQISLQVPYTISASGLTQLEIRVQGQMQASVALSVAKSAPALFPLITNQDGSRNSAAAPAARATVITLYGTGEGLTDGPNVAGLPAAAPYPKPLLPVTLSVAGVSADLLYAGSAPGAAGLLQVNARVPGGYVPPGPAVVTLTVGSVTSPPILIWLQ